MQFLAREPTVLGENVVPLHWACRVLMQPLMNCNL